MLDRSWLLRGSGRRPAGALGHHAGVNDPVKDTSPSSPPHAVARLRAACLADNEARPRLDRGDERKPRCEGCRLLASHCACALRPRIATQAGVCLLMAEFEPLKPSNTGWLTADVVAQTWAFSWSRTAVAPALLALLDDARWQPLVVFPGEFAEPVRVVTELPARALEDGRAPLFILLDGTWSEARKMFRKSPYLDRFPVLSLHPEQLSRYKLRRSWHQHHFCTSEVAALCLALAGEPHAAQTLGAWLDVFSDRYLRAKQSVPPDDTDDLHRRLRELRGGDRDAGIADDPLP
jgi:DTW domain-containing protein YfiP